jgi:hypothetical protein
VTAAPTAPDVIDKLVILGPPCRTVKFTPLLATPLALTTTFPVVAPLGTVTPILEAPHDVTLAVVPLNATVLLPWLEPKFVPVTVTAAPTAPDVTDKLVMLGAGTTVKFTPLLATPETVTTTFPVVAPLGTVTLMLDEPQAVAVAVVPLNFTVLVPCVVPKPVPVIVTEAPTAPEVGDRLVMLVPVITVNVTPLLATPLAFTITFPDVAPLGTVTPILEAPHDVTLALVPLNVTVLLPWLEPKFVPVIVTDAPTAPDVGDRLVMLGAGTIVKLIPLLPNPATVTTTFPVVAPWGTGTTILVDLQLVGAAAVPLNVTVLPPWLDPKLAPLIVTDAPTAPELGDRLVMLGVTVKFDPLLATPETVTTTFPVVAPLGTGTTICVLLQFVGVAVVPLKATVLLPCGDPKFVPVIVTETPTAPEVGDKLVMVGAAA